LRRGRRSGRRSCRSDMRRGCDMQVRHTCISSSTACASCCCATTRITTSTPSSVSMSEPCTGSSLGGTTACGSSPPLSLPARLAHSDHCPHPQLCPVEPCPVYAHTASGRSTLRDPSASSTSATLWPARNCLVISHSMHQRDAACGPACQVVSSSGAGPFHTRGSRGRVAQHASCPCRHPGNAIPSPQSQSTGRGQHFRKFRQTQQN
jgi:hypothetical protein